MEPDRQRRLFVIILLSVALMVSSWFEDDGSDGSGKTPLEVSL